MSVNDFGHLVNIQVIISFQLKRLQSVLPTEYTYPFSIGIFKD